MTPDAADVPASPIQSRSKQSAGDSRAPATCGIDIGARTVKVVIWDAAKRSVVDSTVADTGPLPQSAARSLYDTVLSRCAHEVRRVVATGYGRGYCDFADQQVTEITCHARGVREVLPDARTIIDIGGQDSKIIALDEAGKLLDFAMNDRCAAGTGSFVELVAAKLNMSVDEMSQAALTSRTGVEITSMCAVFAESEIIGLLQSGRRPAAVARGVFDAVARRMGTLARQVKSTPPLAFTGGLALSAAMATAIGSEFGAAPLIPPQPQLTGALGAAMIAAEHVEA